MYMLQLAFKVVMFDVYEKRRRLSLIIFSPRNGCGLTAVPQFGINKKGWP